MTIATGDNDRITLAAITQQQKAESLVWKTRKILSVEPLEQNST